MRFAALVPTVLLCAFATSAAGAERLCDSAHENCRTPLLELIRAETGGIDVAFWFMEDPRYTNDPRPSASSAVNIATPSRASAICMRRTGMGRLDSDV